MKRRRFEVTSALAGETLRGALAELLAVAPVDAQRLIENGAVYVRGRRSHQAQVRVRAGDALMVVLEESGQSTVAAAPDITPLRVLYEDDAFLAVDKPAGVPTQPTPGRVGASLLDAVSLRLGRPAGLIHRLDKDTSGVVLFGKTKAATSEGAAQFRARTARKVYLAATAPGLPQQGTMDVPLARDPSRPGRFRGLRGGHGVSALTDFERLSDGLFHVVVLWPRTGRTHQIRAHLAHAGAPILGDRLYGGPTAAAGLTAPRCLLHAWTLSLGSTGPSVEAPVPPDLAAFVGHAQLRLDPEQFARGG